MPWRVGLDEAGYGPNLGPLVQSSTACYVADDCPACLWELLQAAVRRRDDGIDERLLIDDSKKVNEGPNGLHKLEEGVIAVLRLRGDGHATLAECISTLSLGGCLSELESEPWFAGDDALPLDVRTLPSHDLAEASQRGALIWGPLRAIVTPAPRFNLMLDEWRLKSGVLASGVIALLRATLDLPGDEPIHIAVDKLGGRHYYIPMLSEAFCDGWVRALCEGPERCEYVVDGLGREVRIVFEPRADGQHLNVALASMVAKYLREVCMWQFNRYWSRRLPGIKPTAGYPSDASRFFKSILPTLTADGTPQRSVWRAK